MPALIPMLAAFHAFSAAGECIQIDHDGYRWGNFSLIRPCPDITTDFKQALGARSFKIFGLRLGLAWSRAAVVAAHPVRDHGVTAPLDFTRAIHGPRPAGS
jgi:hypothetical protein